MCGRVVILCGLSLAETSDAEIIVCTWNTLYSNLNNEQINVLPGSFEGGSYSASDIGRAHVTDILYAAFSAPDCCLLLYETHYEILPHCRTVACRLMMQADSTGRDPGGLLTRKNLEECAVRRIR